MRVGLELLAVNGQPLRELVHDDAAVLIWNNWLEHRKLKLLVRVLCGFLLASLLHSLRLK